MNELRLSTLMDIFSALSYDFDFDRSLTDLYELLHNFGVSIEHDIPSDALIKELALRGIKSIDRPRPRGTG